MRKAFMGGTYMSPTIGRRGRIMRAPEGEEGAGGGGGENNNGGESGGGGNNTNVEDALASFWGSPAGDGDSSSQRSGGDGKPAGQQENQNNGNENKGPTFKDRIGTIKAENVMTTEVMEALGEGNAKPFHEAFNGAIRQANEQMFTMTVELMQTFGERLVAEMDSRMNTTHTNRDNNAFLEQHFPSAKDPKIRPLVDKVYQQALGNTKGNRDKAIAQTKEMLKLMSTVTAEDTGLDLGSGGGNGGFGAPSGKPKGGSWLDRLKDEVSQ
jgi:hypothetical protein